MVTLEQFKDNAIRHGICEMIADWDNAKSKRQLMDLCLSAKAIPYVCEAIAEGWGISPDVAHKEFAPFINGKYVRSADGYTSTLWCYPDNVEIKIDSTTALIICHDGEVTIDRPIAEIYLVNSDVIVKSNGIVKAHLYNSVASGDVEIEEDKKYGTI